MLLYRSIQSMTSHTALIREDPISDFMEKSGKVELADVDAIETKYMLLYSRVQ